MAVVIKTVLFTDAFMHEDDHARRLPSSFVPRENYVAMAHSSSLEESLIFRPKNIHLYLKRLLLIHKAWRMNPA